MKKNSCFLLSVRFGAALTAALSFYTAGMPLPAAAADLEETADFNTEAAGTAAASGGASALTADDAAAFELPIEGSTVYPLLDFSASGEGQTTISAGTAMKAVSWADGMITAQAGETTVQADEKLFAVNLPDVMPDLRYDITNSYSSMYISAGYSIFGVSEEKIYSWGDAGGLSWNERLGKNEFTVPVALGTAQKIAKLESLAEENGYCLKVMDAYQPLSVTQNLSAELLARAADAPAVYEALTHGGWDADWFLGEQATAGLRDSVLADTKNGEGTFETGESAGESEGSADGSGTVASSPDATDVSDSDGSGVCASTEKVRYNAHNILTAVDMTLVSLSGMDVMMPTQMHELSVQACRMMEPDSDISAPTLTGDAELLGEMAEKVGLRASGYMWWHFQDTEDYGIQPCDFVPGDPVSVEVEGSRNRKPITSDEFGWQTEPAGEEPTTGVDASVFVAEGAFDDASDYPDDLIETSDSEGLLPPPEPGAALAGETAPDDGTASDGETFSGASAFLSGGDSMSVGSASQGYGGAALSQPNQR